MRILFHHRTRGTDAQRIHIQEIIAAFQQAGHEVLEASLVSVNSEDRIPEEESREAGWKSVLRSLPGGYDLAQLGYNVVGIPMLLARLWRFRPDFVYERYALHNFAGIVAARLAGKTDRAAAAVEAALAADPMDPVAMVERLFAADSAGPAEIRDALGVDEDLYLEVALFYDGIGLSDAALAVARAGEEFAGSGLYYYYLAWLAGRAGEPDAAAGYAETALEMGTDYVFPHRREAIEAFDYVAETTGQVAYPQYFQGVMLYWLGRQDDAVDMWQDLVGRYEVPGLYRIVATAYTCGRLASDLKTAEGLYLKAIDQDPDDADAYAELAEVYDAMDDWSSRRDILRKARRLFPENDLIALMTAVMLSERRDYGEAAEILENHEFKRAHQSRELWYLAWRAITSTYTGLAVEALEDGDREKAMENLEKAAGYRDTISRWFD